MSIHFNSSNIYKGLLNKVLFLLKSTVFIKLFQSNFARTHKNFQKKYKTENTPKNNVLRPKKRVQKRSSEPHHRRETLFFKIKISKLGEKLRVYENFGFFNFFEKKRALF